MSLVYVLCVLFSVTQIMAQTGMTYEEFLAKMIGIMSRVHGRFGLGKTGLNFNLKDIEKFLATFTSMRYTSLRHRSACNNAG